MRTCDTVVGHPLPYASYRNFKMFKISVFEFGIVSMRSEMRSCADEFLATIIEGIVQGLYMVVTKLSFGVIWRHKASGDKWIFRHCFTSLHTNLDWYLKDMGVSSNAYNRWLHAL